MGLTFLMNMYNKQMGNIELTVNDLEISSDMITEQFEYRGFTFQRMTKDGKWYVCYANQIVNWGRYRNDLKAWVDKHYK